MQSHSNEDESCYISMQVKQHVYLYLNASTQRLEMEENSNLEIQYC